MSFGISRPVRARVREVPGGDGTSAVVRDGNRRELSKQINRENLTLMLFLATDEARWVTGSTVTADGGYLAI